MRVSPAWKFIANVFRQFHLAYGVLAGFLLGRYSLKLLLGCEGVPILWVDHFERYLFGSCCYLPGNVGLWRHGEGGAFGQFLTLRSLYQNSAASATAAFPSASHQQSKGIVALASSQASRISLSHWSGVFGSARAISFPRRAIAPTPPAATPSPAPPASSQWHIGAGPPSAPSRCLRDRRPRRCRGRTAPSAGLSPGIPPVATARRGA
jgi:hypothetical protein